VTLPALLAHLYTDAALRDEALRDPAAVAARFGVDRAVLDGIDREGLVLAAESFARKRAATARPSLWRRVRALLGRP